MRTPFLPCAALCLAAAAAPALGEEAARREPLAIDWNAATPRQAEAVPAGVNAVSLPVLLLAAGGDWGAPRFHGQGSAYAALYAPPGARLSILGSSSRIVAPAGVKLEHPPAAFESIGDGADYSFVRFGAAYTLRLVCDEPLKDKRCTDPHYLTEAARALVVAGGNAR